MRMRDEEELKATKELGFKGPEGRAPVEGDLVLQGKLGSGGYGVVTLWILRDSDDRIVDRVPVKDSSGPRSDWKSWGNFYGDVEDLEPREAIMHSLASEREQDSDHGCIVRYRGSAVFNSREVIRIYTWRAVTLLDFGASRIRTDTRMGSCIVRPQVGDIRVLRQSYSHHVSHLVCK